MRAAFFSAAVSTKKNKTAFLHEARLVNAPNRASQGSGDETCAAVSDRRCGKRQKLLNHVPQLALPRTNTVYFDVHAMRGETLRARVDKAKSRERNAMTVQLGLIRKDPSTVAIQTTCAICSGFDLNVCQSTLQGEWAISGTKPIPIYQSTHVAPARRIVCRDGDLHDAVPVICDGWAASIATLSDSSRQILSILLPGDIVSTTLLFDSRGQYLVEAITDVRYRIFRRSELKPALFKRTALLENLSKAWVEEKSRADQLIVDLGRRTADERIARLILNLVERLAKRGMARGEPIEMDFPLRQRHIADATGLTSVHVSKVLTEFRRAGLIKLRERSLTILDLGGFRRVANMR